MSYELSLADVNTHLKKKCAPYHVQQILGSGNSVTVVKGFDVRLNEHVAIKFIHASKLHEYICSEVCNHRTLRHPHVISFKRAMEIGGHLALVTEHADGASLFQLVKLNRRLSEPLSRWIFQQLILAVDYCHRKGVFSKSINCENVLLQKGKKLPIVKLSDFGYTKSPKSSAGSIDYNAPEGSGDAKGADVWSCGVVLYIMLAGHYPFTRKHIPRRDSAGREEIRQKVEALEYKIPAQLSEDARNLLHAMLTDSERRLTIEEVLRHPWFLRDFPAEAHTLNSTLLADEEKRKATSLDWQSDEEIEHEILRASWFEKLKRPRDLLPDSVIDEEFDQEEERNRKMERKDCTGINPETAPVKP